MGLSFSRHIKSAMKVEEGLVIAKVSELISCQHWLSLGDSTDRTSRDHIHKEKKKTGLVVFLNDMILTAYANEFDKSTYSFDSQIPLLEDMKVMIRCFLMILSEFSCSDW
jgi:hypothetical protein